MTATARRARLAAARAGRLGPWVIVAQGAAALAVSMGIGRFVYTPILPLMGREAGLSKSFGATLATANYAGSLLGALAGIVSPALVRSTWVMHAPRLVSVGCDARAHAGKSRPRGVVRPSLRGRRCQCAGFRVCREHDAVPPAPR